MLDKLSSPCTRKVGAPGLFFLLGLSALLLLGCTPRGRAPVQEVPLTPGSSPARAVSLGQTVVAKNGAGRVVEVTLVEATRGQEAWNKIKDLNGGNQPPPPGTEYLLIKLRLLHRADPIYLAMVSSAGLTAFGPDGEILSRPGESPFAPPVVLPGPRFNDIPPWKVGEAQEQWELFQIPEGAKPIYIAFGGGLNILRFFSYAPEEVVPPESQIQGGVWFIIE